MGPDSDGSGPRLPTLVSFLYNNRDEQTQMTRRLDGLTNAVTSYTFDALGRVQSSTDPRQEVTTMGYDPMDRLTEVTDPEGSALHYVYNTLGQMKQQTDDAGRLINYTYDDAGNLTYSQTNLSSFSFDFDALGRLDEAKWVRRLRLVIHHLHRSETTYRRSLKGGIFLWRTRSPPCLSGGCRDRAPT